MQQKKNGIKSTGRHTAQSMICIGGSAMKLLTVLCMGLTPVSGQMKSCNLNNPCSCTMNDGSGIVDLTSLGTTDDTPKFKDIPGLDGSTFSYSACGGFTEGTCSDAAVCMADGEIQEQIGTAESAAFVYNDDDDNVMVVYTSGGGGLVQQTSVVLHCDPDACSPTLTIDGIVTPEAYRMELTTVCACPGQCTASGPTSCGEASGGFSAGAALIITFFCCIFLYLTIGSAYMKVKNKASGTDLIPNKDLWTSVPSYIAGGFKFLLGKCRRKSAYESI